MMAAQEQSEQGAERHNGEQSVVIMEHAPGRPGISPIYELEKTVEDDLLLPIIQKMKDRLFGELIKENYRACNCRDALVRV